MLPNHALCRHMWEKQSTMNYESCFCELMLRARVANGWKIYDKSSKTFIGNLSLGTLEFKKNKKVNTLKQIE